MIRTAYAVAKRELLSYFLSPISYVLAALFLIVHGYSFFLLCQILGSQRAQTGAVMTYFFGGTFLYWLFLMFIVAALTMRLIAEERQRGTLEPLLTAPVREGAVVLGKYIAAVGFYVLLWAPTLAYPTLLRAYAGEASSLDPGPIAAGYLGTLLCGLSALGIGLLASTVARSQVLAAALSFTALSLLLLVGMLADLYVKNEGLAAALLYVNLFHHMDELGRGIVDSRRVVYHLSIGVAAVFVAARVLRARPGDSRGLSRAAVEGVLSLLLVVAVNAIAARHPVRLDWTRAHVFTLSPRLTGLLAELPRPVRALVFMYDDGADKNDLYDDVHELLLRAQAASGRLSVEFIDVDRDRDKARLLGERYKISRDDLREGVIVVECEGRTKFITRGELADYETVDTGAGAQQRMTAFRGQEALAAAVLTVVEGKTREVCFTRGHGEAVHDSLAGGGLSDLSEALRRDNFSVRALEQLGEVPRSCDVLAIPGPERAFLPAEAEAVERHLDRGGRVLLLLGPQLDPGLTRFLDSGLGDVMRRRGIGLPPGVVIDPEHQIEGSLAWVVEEGYGDHPISAPLLHQRTLWTLARPVRPLPAVPLPSGALWSAQALVSTSDRGFAETDMAALRDGHPVFTSGTDEAGPVAVAVAAQVKEGVAKDAEGGAGRLVVIGAANIATNEGMVLYNRDLLLAAVTYLADTGRRVIIDPQRPETLRLALTEDQARRLMLVTLIGMPLMALLLGLGVFWVRRA